MHVLYNKLNIYSPIYSRYGIPTGSCVWLMSAPCAPSRLCAFFGDFGPAFGFLAWMCGMGHLGSNSPNYRKVSHRTSVGGRREAVPRRIIATRYQSAARRLRASIWRVRCRAGCLLRTCQRRRRGAWGLGRRFLGLGSASLWHVRSSSLGTRYR